MRIAYIGNFGPEHSTENHVARAIEHNGHEVVRVQENTAWENVAAFPTEVNFVLWTHTHDLGPEGSHGRQVSLLKRLQKAGIPSVSFHLDLWWGLKREHQVKEEPFFHTDLVITADGANDDKFAAEGINHFWLPPAISLAEAELGTPTHEYRSKVAFVGNWQGGYHPEYQHRAKLVSWLQTNFRGNIKFWPLPGKHAVRGKALQDLYASVDILVGDSCLINGPRRYSSDRIPETIGRGGFLFHPAVEDLTDGTHWTSGEHLVTWNLNDWAGLKRGINNYLQNPDERKRIATAGREHAREHHTYERRVEQIIEQLNVQGML